VSGGKRRQAAPRKGAGGGFAAGGAHPGGGGAVNQPGADQRDFGEGLSDAVGEGLFGGHPVRAHVSAVGGVLLSGEPRPGGEAVRPGGGVGRADGQGAGPGPVLWHGHHFPGNGEKSGAGDGVRNRASGGGGRQGQRPAQRH